MTGKTVLILKTREEVFRIVSKFPQMSQNVSKCPNMSQNITKCPIQTHRFPNGLVLILPILIHHVLRFKDIHLFVSSTMNCVYCALIAKQNF